MIKMKIIRIIKIIKIIKRIKIMKIILKIKMNWRIKIKNSIKKRKRKINKEVEGKNSNRSHFECGLETPRG